MLLFVVGCTSTSDIESVTVVLKIPKVNLEVKNPNVLHIDMSNKESVLDMFKRSGAKLPIPFNNRAAETRAQKLCKVKQKSWRANRFNSYSDVNMILYGMHPTRPGVFMCLPDKVTKFQAKHYCKTIKRKLDKYEDKNHHQFSCIKEN